MQFVTADLSHLDFLVQLEAQSFTPDRQSSRKSIKNSITSKSQQVILLKHHDQWVGSITIMTYKRTLRIYSLAIAASAKGKGYGSTLVKHVITYAKAKNYSAISLEADASNLALIDFYQKLGFVTELTLHHYYAQDKHAVKMLKHLAAKAQSLVVIDYDTTFFDAFDTVSCIRAKDYIEDPAYHQASNIRVFNLCKSTAYQTVGYYVSLLGYARNQKVIPSTATLRDFKNRVITKSLGDELYEQIQDHFSDHQQTIAVIDAYFGHALNPKDNTLLSKLMRIFEVPLARFEFRKYKRWELYKVMPLALDDCLQVPKLTDYAKDYFNNTRFKSHAIKHYEYDLAILVDPNEASPPSNKVALEKFKATAEKMGFYVEFITKHDYKRLTEFDALFIRATTNVDDYTYDFSRYAYSEGLVVIDDPWSILGCSNKLFLYEKMRLADIQMPQTWLLSKKSNYADVFKQLDYPLILKQPDSAFSLGVHKVTSPLELEDKLKALYKTSELVIAQQYLPSDFDWRVGVLNGKVLFVCKYYMAKGHWQIYNWNANHEETEGDFDTLPLDQVPQQVLHMAVKSSLAIGDGLYGVDIKEVDGQLYLIEVNDNPNIDHGIEDLVMGDLLYEEIIKQIYSRIENARHTERFTSI